MKQSKIIQVCAIDVTMDKILRELYASSVERGYKVIGVCSRGKATEKLIDEGFNIVSIKIDRSIKPISNLKSVLCLYKLFRKEKPDIVHVHTPIAAVLSRIAARLARVPNIIYTAHGFYFHENMMPIIYRITLAIEKIMAKYFTDLLFTQSKEDADTAVRNEFKTKDKIIAIGNGVDAWRRFNPQNVIREEIDSLKAELGIREEDKVITFVGRLVREKGIMDLLQAFVMLNRDDTKLVIVGEVSQGDRDKETIKLIQGFKKYKNIVFTGDRNDINNILYLSDIFCLPSYREGMPRTIIEAMAMNCAVVATNIRGAREEVVDGETGYLVNLASSQDIRDKIASILDNSSLMESMKLKGRLRVEEFYDEKKIVQLQIDIFDRLTKG